MNLERGKWSYVILSHHDAWIDATGSFTEALRIARRYLATSSGTQHVTDVRLGLAYGLIVQRTDGLMVTIIPTPRHLCSHGLRSTHHPMYGKCIDDA